MRHQSENYLRMGWNVYKAYHAWRFTLPMSSSSYCFSFGKSIHNNKIYTNNKQPSLILAPQLLLFLLLSVENYATLLYFVFVSTVFHLPYYCLTFFLGQKGLKQQEAWTICPFVKSNQCVSIINNDNLHSYCMYHLPGTVLSYHIYWLT